MEPGRIKDEDVGSGGCRQPEVRVAEIIEFLEYLAPSALASPRTPFGLQVGSATASVQSVVVAPLPNFGAISCAAARRAALLVTAVPLLSRPLDSLRWDDPIGARIAHLTQRQISLYALPTSFAAAPGGFDDCLAERLGLAAHGPLLSTIAEPQLKFVVFVPLPDLPRVREAAAEAGAGLIGAYSHCSFVTQGAGTFLGQRGSHPAIGKVGILAEVPEARLEMLVPEREVKSVLAAVLEAHPYEEVAYDLYPLRNPGVLYGRGRIGELPLKVSLETVLAQVHDALGFGPDHSIRCSHRPGLPIGSLAVASGSGIDENLLWAAHRQQAGALVVGGAGPEDLLLADSTSTVLIDVGLGPSVGPGLQRLVAQLRDTFDVQGVEIISLS